MGYTERERKKKSSLSFRDGRDDSRPTRARVNNNVMLIIINLFLYIRLREKASSNARGEATRRRRTSNLSLSSPSLSLSLILSRFIYTHALFLLSFRCVLCRFAMVTYFISLLSLSYKPDRPHTTSANENEKEDKIAPQATSTKNGSPSATCATTFCAAWDASGETMEAATSAVVAMTVCCLFWFQKKKRGFRESSSSIRFLLRISTRVFPPLLYDQAGSLRRRDRKKINPADAQNLSSVFRTNLPSGKRKNHSGRDGRARKSSATSRARECTRRDFLRLFFSRATGGPPPPPPPHFCALPVWTTTTEKSIVFLPHTKGHIRALKRKEEKKTKEKDHQNKHEHHHHRRKAKERTFSTVGFFNAFAGFALARFVCAEFVRVVWATTFAEEAATAYMIFFFISLFFCDDDERMNE